MRWLLALIAFVLGGCSSVHYAKVKRGKLSGALTVRWISPDRFIFLPDPQNPLKFERSNREVIQPGRMLTDGGSIPRPLWAFRSYSPWGYAPAFIIHDWLFDMQHCSLPGHEKYDVHEAALVMSEILKTMREDKPDQGPSKFVIYTMFLAVDSDIAKDLWEHGKCERPPDLIPEVLPGGAMEYKISWP